MQHDAEVTQLIQVTWSMADEQTRRREIEGLQEASELTGCKSLLIITADEEETIQISADSTIRVIPAWKWLLSRQ